MDMILTAAALTACIWTYATDLRGKHYEVSDILGAKRIEVMYRYGPSGYWEDQRQRLANDPKLKNRLPHAQ